MLNINYNCYSLHCKKLPIQTKLLISSQAQGILGSCARDRKHHGSPTGANGEEGEWVWVCQVMVAGLRLPEEPSAEAEPVLRAGGSVGTASPEKVSDAQNGSAPSSRAFAFDSDKSRGQHGVGATASASTVAKGT